MCMKAFSQLATLAIGLLLLPVGCGHKSGSQLSSADQAAFDQATPEVKAAWIQASEAVKTNGYVTAYNLFYDLGSADLTAEQKQAVIKASTALNEQLLAAVDKGDPAAQEALAEMRSHPPSRKRNN